VDGGWIDTTCEYIKDPDRPDTRRATIQCNCATNRTTGTGTGTGLGRAHLQISFRRIPPVTRLPGYPAVTPLHKCISEARTRCGNGGEMGGDGMVARG
jgi:hypothetical protein